MDGGGIPLDAGGLAAVAAYCWGGDILVSARMARRLSGCERLAVVVLITALLSAPYGISHAGAHSWTLIC